MDRARFPADRENGTTPEQGFDKVESLRRMRGGESGEGRRKPFSPTSPPKDTAMKTVIVIQARLGSSRLPCKTLLNLHGLPVIDWVVGRCARSELADDLVVALPDTRRDEVLARHLRAQGVNTFRGSEQDVLSRRHGAAAAHGADLVVRVCADNPLIWGGEIDNLIRFYQREHTAGNCDYAYNHIPRNNLYPDGLGAEIVSFELFTKAMNEATLPAHREHCLSYIVDNPELFAIRTFDPLDPALHHPEMKLDMDTADDFINLALRDIHPDITPREIVELFR